MKSTTHKQIWQKGENNPNYSQDFPNLNCTRGTYLHLQHLSNKNIYIIIIRSNNK
jgi:hypothetical protein